MHPIPTITTGGLEPTLPAPTPSKPSSPTNPPRRTHWRRCRSYIIPAIDIILLIGLVVYFFHLAFAPTPRRERQDAVLGKPGPLSVGVIGGVIKAEDVLVTGDVEAVVNMAGEGGIPAKEHAKGWGWLFGWGGDKNKEAQVIGGKEGVVLVGGEKEGEGKVQSDELPLREQVMWGYGMGPFEGDE